MNKRVLITGGFGYLGGRIAVELAKQQNLIIRLGTRKHQVAPVWLPEAEVVVMDVREPSSLIAALDGVHQVVHLAAMNEHACLENPKEAIDVNIAGTYALLQAAMRQGVERFIYFSTAHVYAAPLVGVISELTVPKPVHPYAITHHAAEDFVLAAHAKKALTGLVVRLSNGFGAPMHLDVDRWTLLVNDLCYQAVQYKKLKLNSSGQQLRDFVTLEDVGRGVAHLLNLPAEQCGDGLFNLGGEMPLSILEMTRRIAMRCEAVLGFLPEITYPHLAHEEMITGAKLCYQMDKIKASGFQLTKQIDTAIVETLYLLKKEVG